MRFGAQAFHLKAGYNVIWLAEGSPAFAGGSGYAELDSITVATTASVPAWSAPANPAAASYVARSEAEAATVTHGTVYSSANASGGKYVRLSVSAGAASNLSLPVTGAWGANGGSFPVATTQVQLNAGANTIALSHLANQNYAELDYLQLSSPASAVVR